MLFPSVKIIQSLVFNEGSTVKAVSSSSMYTAKQEFNQQLPSLTVTESKCEILAKRHPSFPQKCFKLERKYTLESETVIF